MATTTLITWICDLCQDTAETDAVSKLPKDWISLTLDHPIEERAWVTKHVCPDCVIKILKASNFVKKV